jgi:hypothetical protein
MTILNYALDNGFLFYGTFAGIVGLIGYSFTTSYLNSFYADKGIQTDAWEDYSDRPSQIGSQNLTSIDTVTPISENISPTIQTTSEIGIQTLTDGTSTVTTVLPIPPVKIEMVPNPDLTNNVVDIIVVGYDYIDRAHALADIACGGFL